MGPLLRLAEECLQGGGGVMVHCMQGKHRAGAFCAVLSAIIHILFDPLRHLLRIITISKRFVFVFGPCCLKAFSEI